PATRGGPAEHPAADPHRARAHRGAARRVELSQPAVAHRGAGEGAPGTDVDVAGSDRHRRAPAAAARGFRPRSCQPRRPAAADEARAVRDPDHYPGFGGQAMMGRKRSSAKVAPITPCGRDLGPNRGWVVELEGQTKSALEVGRTRLLVTGFVFALAFLGVA